MREKQVYRESCPIIHKEFPTPDSCLLTVASTNIASAVKPGQFVNILPISGKKFDVDGTGPHILDNWEPGEESTNPRVYSLLRRPFSMHDVMAPSQNEPGSFTILFRILGKGTRLLADTPEETPVDVLGPLGIPYPLPASPITTVYILAGGFGAAPLIPLAEDIKQRGLKIVFFWGVETASSILLECLEDGCWDSSLSELVVKRLQQQDIPSFIAVRQGAQGAFQGTVVDLFEHYCAHHETETEVPMIYTCGPEMMMRSIAMLATERAWPCRVSLEKYMACGIGACMSCVCKMKRPDDPQGFLYQRTCTEGPSFWGENVLWD